MAEDREIRILLSLVSNPQNRAEIARAMDGLGGQALDDINRKLSIMSGNMDMVRKNYTAARQEVERMSQTAERLSSAGTKMAGLGVGLLAPLVISAREYVKEAGKSEAASSRWLENTDRLEQAQLRIGRVVAEQVSPAMDLAASLAEKMAAAAEKSPGLIGAALGIGAGLLSGGTLTTLVGQGIKLVADVKFIAATGTMAVSAKMIQGAAAQMLTAAGLMQTSSKTGLLSGVMGGLTRPLIPGAAAAVSTTTAARLAMATGATAPSLFGIPLTAAGGITGASLAAALSPLTVLGGLGLGGLGYNAIAKQMGWQSAGTILGKTGSSLAYGAGYLFGGQEKANEWFLAAAQALGVLGDEAKNLAGNLPKAMPKEAVRAFIDFQRANSDASAQYAEQRNQIETDYSRKRSDITRQYAEQRSEIERNYEQQRTNIVQNYARTRARAEEDFQRSQDKATADFARTETEAYADYQQQRADAVASYNQSIEDLEAAHRERLRKMAEDHEGRVEELVAARDALGLAAENRRYKREQAQEKRDYQAQRREARKNLNEQLAQMDAEFQAQKAKRAEEFARKQAEAQEEFDLQQQRRKEDYQRQLADLEASHKEQQQSAARNFQEQLQAAGRHYRESLSQLERNFREEKQRRLSAFNQQLIDLGVHTGKVKQEWEKFYADMETKLRQFIDRANSMGNDAGAGSRAFGGYAGFGLYRLGDAPSGGPGGREFVLNASTTRMAEKFIGGSLTQGRMVAALAGGGGISIGAINMPAAAMNEAQYTRFMQNKFPDLLATALEKAQRGLRI